VRRGRTDFLLLICRLGYLVMGIAVYSMFVAASVESGESSSRTDDLSTCRTRSVLFLQDDRFGRDGDLVP